MTPTTATSFADLRQAVAPGFLTLAAGPYWGAAERGMQTVASLHSRLVEAGETLVYAGEVGPEPGVPHRFYFEAEDGVLLSFEHETIQAFLDRGAFAVAAPRRPVPLGRRQRLSPLAAPAATA